MCRQQPKNHLVGDPLIAPFYPLPQPIFMQSDPIRHMHIYSPLTIPFLTSYRYECAVRNQYQTQRQNEFKTWRIYLLEFLCHFSSHPDFWVVTRALRTLRTSELPQLSWRSNASPTPSLKPHHFAVPCSIVHTFKAQRQLRHPSSMPLDTAANLPRKFSWLRIRQVDLLPLLLMTFVSYLRFESTQPR